MFLQLWYQKSWSIYCMNVNLHLSGQFWFKVKIGNNWIKCVKILFDVIEICGIKKENDYKELSKYLQVTLSTITVKTELHTR